VFILPSTLFCELDPLGIVDGDGNSSGVVGAAGGLVDLVTPGGRAKAAAGGTGQCA